MGQHGLGTAGVALLGIGLVSAILTMIIYGIAAFKTEAKRLVTLGRVCYSVTAASVLSVFGTLGFIVYSRDYRYMYAFEHTSNDLHNWYRFAATWAGQEGSFLLWAAWTAVIGFLVFAKAGKYKSRVMPFFVSVLAFLCGILLKQTPFQLTPTLSAAELAAHPGLHALPVDGQGLNPSLQNYWMTIHPPTIFFGFASLAVPFCYAIAAMIWKDYERWTPRVMPYALLSCATLGLGLFMGGYWAYETQGWHGFWAWDPVENASFFPWLAITALVHGLVVQKSRGGMARTTTFLGVLAFSLFLVGTFLTRSGALASKDASGQLLSVHAFDNIGKSALFLMAAMVIVYGGGGLMLWLARIWNMPRRPATGDTLVSRDFAFFLAVLLMILACVAVTLGTTQPLVQSWLHKTPDAPKAAFYNKIMLPLSLLTALVMGCVPWLAWRKTNPELFLRKLLIPWFAMLIFGFCMVFWVQGAERALNASLDPSWPDAMETAKAWITPTAQRLAVVSLSALGFFAALSNAMLAYRVFRAKPLSAGGWLAHVGIGLLMVGIIVSNTYERTERFVLREGDPPIEKFGYKFSFEKMSGKIMNVRPLHPEYDPNNEVQLRVTPPGADDASNRGSEGAAKTFLVSPRWFVYKFASNEAENETMRWPSITKTVGHDLYVAMANDASYLWKTDDPNRERPGVVLSPAEKRQLAYRIGYYEQYGEPGKLMGAHLAIATQEGKVVEAFPAKRITEQGLVDINASVPELPFEDGTPGAIYLDRLDPATKAATLLVSLPGFTGAWSVPLEVTFKPWINLVWIGVLIAVAGTLLAMLRRALEARKLTDDGRGGPKEEKEVWEMPEAEEPLAVTPGAVAAPIVAQPALENAIASAPSGKSKTRRVPQA